MVETVTSEPVQRPPGYSPSGRSPRLTSIDFLRGCAATAVVLHHMVNWSTPPESTALYALHTVLDNGYLGVPLFFVISGFCIHMRWARRRAREHDPRLDFGDFWRRRLRRLYPPYFVMLCFSMGLVVAAYLLGRDTPLLAIYPEPRPAWIAFDFGLHALMLHGFDPVYDRAGGNPPFWTLAREEYFYLMYFALLAWRKRWGLAVSTAVVLVVGVAFTTALRPFIPDEPLWIAFVYSSAIALWIQWTLGMVAAEAYVGLFKLPRWCSNGLLVPVWAAVAALSEYGPDVLAAPLWGMTFFTLLNWCVRVEVEGRWPKWRIVAWLANVGIFSYSLYLIHNPVRAVLKQMLGPVKNTESAVVFLAVAALLVVASYVAAAVFFRLVERRFLNDAR
jgi:peptidoglycan/LPS O-acetylase OafA/YrhL